MEAISFASALLIGVVSGDTTIKGPLLAPYHSVLAIGAARMSFLLSLGILSLPQGLVTLFWVSSHWTVSVPQLVHFVWNT